MSDRRPAAGSRAGSQSGISARRSRERRTEQQIRARRFVLFERATTDGTFTRGSNDAPGPRALPRRARVRPHGSPFAPCPPTTPIPARTRPSTRPCSWCAIPPASFDARSWAPPGAFGDAPVPPLGSSADRAPCPPAPPPPPSSQWGCGEDGQLGLASAPVTASSCALDWHVPTPTPSPSPSAIASPRATASPPPPAPRGEPQLRRRRPLRRALHPGLELPRHPRAGHREGVGPDPRARRCPPPGAGEASSPRRRRVRRDRLPPPLPPAAPESPAPAAASSVRAAALGGWHALAVDASGACRAWGGNEYGQAGVNDEDDSEDDSDEDDATRPLDGTEVASPERLHQSRKNRRDDGVHVCLHVSSPAKILRGVRVSQVACGGMNSFAVTEKTGEVYQWGMPVGSEKEPARRPALVPGAVGVTQIAAGTFHAVALQRDGRVVSWGNGDYGQLGLGRPGNWDQPQVVESLSRAGVVLVRAGGWHSAAITAGRVCYVWGRGEYGRLGQGDQDDKDKQRPVEIKLPWSGASDRGHGGGGGGGGGPTRAPRAAAGILPRRRPDGDRRFASLAAAARDRGHRARGHAHVRAGRDGRGGVLRGGITTGGSGASRTGSGRGRRGGWCSRRRRAGGGGGARGSSRGEAHARHRRARAEGTRGRREPRQKTRGGRATRVEAGVRRGEPGEADATLTRRRRDVDATPLR